jgi:hypothetical protein
MLKQYRLISEIQKDLKAAKRELRMVVNSAGDDMGCDGSREDMYHCQGEISNLEIELQETRESRKTVKES